MSRHGMALSWFFLCMSLSLLQEQSPCQQSLGDVSLCKILHILFCAGRKLASGSVASLACLLLIRLG